jgi:two-component system, chemotaxis family, response regulator Rcp1
MSAQSGSPIEIMIVEDNAGDVRLAREALRESKIRNILHHVPVADDRQASRRIWKGSS